MEYHKYISPKQNEEYISMPDKRISGPTKCSSDTNGIPIRLCFVIKSSVDEKKHAKNYPVYKEKVEYFELDIYRPLQSLHLHGITHPNLSVFNRNLNIS